MKNIYFFLSESVKFLEVIFSIYLNRRAFVMLMNFPACIAGPPASILHKSTADCYRPVSYPDGPITAAIDLCKMLTGPYLTSPTAFTRIS